jgi:S-(hydroxymethyl)glutathione dehydrogenase / alcohol dehydrogenase
MSADCDKALIANFYYRVKSRPIKTEGFMKAAVCREFGQPLVIEEVKLAPPGAGEVKVKLSACAICHSDIIFMDGGWGGNLPQIFGHEASGTVTAIGEGVKNTKPGDKVIVTLIRSCGHCATCESGEPYICSTPYPQDSTQQISGSAGEKIFKGLKTGGFAEYAVVDQSQIVIIPDSVPMDSASLLSCGVITGLGAVVNTASVPFGSSVGIIGCGGVGLNAVQGAALVGANPILAIDLIDAKLKTALDFGATHISNPLTAKVKEDALSITSGAGLDYVFVAAGNIKAFEQGLELLSLSGTMVLVGMPPNGHSLDVDVGTVANNGQKILGSKMGSTRLRVDIPRLIDLYVQGRLKLDELVTKRYPLEQINEAVDAVRQDKALRNVIIFDEG